MIYKLNLLSFAIIIGIVIATSACGSSFDNNGYPSSVTMKCRIDTVTVWGESLIGQIELYDTKGNCSMYGQSQNDTVKVTNDWLTIIHPIKKQPTGKYKITFISTPNNHIKTRSVRIGLHMGPHSGSILISQPGRVD